MKRSVAPVFWLLFGAGGMLAALLGPALVVITGFVVPFGSGSHGTAAGFSGAAAFAHNPFGKLLLFGVIALFAWHGAERVFLTLHDMHAGPKPVLARLCYGTAAIVTLIAATVLLALGF